MLVSGWFILQFPEFQDSDNRSRPTSYRIQLNVKLIFYSANFHGRVFNMTIDTVFTYRKGRCFIMYQI